ncbi:MAG: hypothetical protein WD894_26420 [Pirellulales bacterium]
MAYDLIAKWNRDPATDIRSDALPTAVQSLPEAECIGLPTGAKAIYSSFLAPAVRRDLDIAVTGFLQATRESKPEGLIAYMRERGQSVNRKYRKFMERALLKRGMTDVEKLSDEEVYVAGIASSKLGSDTHWRGLVANSSCRQFWDGKHVPLNRMRFDENSAPGTPPGQLEQAAFLMRILHGNSSNRCNFISDTGSLQDAHRDDPEVLLCDLQLIIELDESYSRVKAAYLLRFWFNPRVKKWQPEALMGFATDPHKLALPSVMF